MLNKHCFSQLSCKLIHIVSLQEQLITETRVLRDVFNPADFDRVKRTWDKRLKVEFIQRLIDHLAKNEQPVVGCVAAKVIAGLEPNKTNELLQALARLARARLSGRDASSGRPRTFTRNSASPKVNQTRKSNQSRENSAARPESSRKSSLNKEAEKKSPTKSDLEEPGKELKTKAEQTPVAQEKIESNNNNLPVRPQKEAQQQQAVVLRSQNDIGKHLSLLKTNLKQLKSIMNEASHYDKQIRLVFNGTSR